MLGSLNTKTNFSRQNMHECSAKKIIKNLLLPFGLEIHKKMDYSRSSLIGVLNNLKKNGFEPNTVIDIGAAFGSWSTTCAQVFSEANYLLIEPLAEYWHPLTETVSKIKKAQFVSCCIADKNEETNIFVHADLVGSSLFEENEPHNQNATEKRNIQCKTLDETCSTKNIQPPFLLKIDVQGAELKVLNGGGATLKHTGVIIMEVSLIECIKNSPSFADVITNLSANGFVVYDIFGHNYRPCDQALAQVDILFVPELSPLRKIKWYANEIQRQKMNKKFFNEYNRLV